MPACQADALLVVVAYICGENYISLLAILHSLILVDHYHCHSYWYTYITYEPHYYAFSLHSFIIRPRVWSFALVLQEHLFICEGHIISITEPSLSKFMEPRWNVDWSFTFDPGQEDMG